MMAVDVGQGDCTVVIGTDGTVLLIDGGGPGHGATVETALNSQSLSSVDHVLVTHFDADHLAGLAEFLLGPDNQPGTADDGAPDAVLWDYGDDGECTSQTCDRYRLARAGRARVITPGEVIPLGQASAECVAVNGVLADGRLISTTDENARSISLLIRHGVTRALIAGDLTGGGLMTSDIETPVAQLVGRLDLLHINHHGSNTSSNATALGLWSPRLGLMSVGTDNSYCHPAADVQERLSASGMQLWTTGSGTVQPGDRCDATLWPSTARAGQGTIQTRLYGDGTVYVEDEQVP
jgi:beta-lactamase superfamily II metal-dependent hydrolase